MLKNRAFQKVRTVKPLTNSAQSKITSALITRRNRPNVSNVTGSVKITRTGFTNKFSNPSTIATITDVMKLSTATPGNSREMKSTKIDVSRIRRIRFIVMILTKVKILLRYAANNLRANVVTRRPN